MIGHDGRQQMHEASNLQTRARVFAAHNRVAAAAACWVPRLLRTASHSNGLLRARASCSTSSSLSMLFVVAPWILRYEATTTNLDVFHVPMTLNPVTDRHLDVI